jgi:hypothetical protein
MFVWRVCLVMHRIQFIATGRPEATRGSHRRHFHEEGSLYTLVRDDIQGRPVDDVHGRREKIYRLGTDRRDCVDVRWIHRMSDRDYGYLIFWTGQRGDEGTSFRDGAGYFG